MGLRPPSGWPIMDVPETCLLRRGLESLKTILTVESPAVFRRRRLFVGEDALDRPRRLAEPISSS
jgi:hypothetical protein